MSLSATERRELFTALNELRNATLSDEQKQSLQILVTNNEEACQLYVEHMFLVATLRWSYGESEIAAEATQGPVTNLFPRIRRTTVRWFSPRMLGVAASLLLVGYFVSIVGLLAWDRIHRAVRHDQFAFERSEHTTVATISDVVDAKWAKNAASKLTNSSIRSGEPLKIDSGTIELELSAGTKLVVEGPAAWSVDGNNSVSLRAGRLLAQVPQQAIGFTVETPTAKIVDLGTEFGVEVSQSGATDVQVLKGKIELHPGERASDSSRVQQPITLSAGSAVRVEPAPAGGVPAVREITATRNRFARKTDSSKPQRIPVFGALASSECFANLRVNNLINGSGLKGEGHSSLPDNTMWLAEFGKIKNEYVLFDLGRIYRLDSMKVWNYNEYVNEAHENYKYRGVAQADIFVSTTGKGTPLDHPDDWKLVIAKARFEPADGKPDYSTPGEVLLDGATARFVAIVIKARTDPEGPEHKIDPECVGLSEVQFFGQRIKPSERPTAP